MYNYVIPWHTQLKAWGYSYKEQFLYVLKLSWYKFKLDCYNFRIVNVIPMVKTKKWLTKHTQKEIRKELKHFTTKNQLSTKQDSSAGKEGTKHY